MRPPEFTGGNIGIRNQLRQGAYCFNEAAGIHRRKPASAGLRGGARGGCFNEAAGIHRRKQEYQRRRPRRGVCASMRPPEFTGGNKNISAADRDVVCALQ